jgi:AcrR family transcriptional regulator
MDLEHILLAGEKHFFAKQYSDVKLDNIANELGIKKPSLYYYFTNKREYYIKTLKYSMKKYVQALRHMTDKNSL